MKPQLIKCGHEEYSEIDALRSSDLKVFIESPQKYEDVCIKKMYPRKPTDSMRMGTILHQFVLESKTQEGIDYAIWTGSKRSGAKWEHFIDSCESNGMTYLIKNNDKDELGLIELQVKAILKNKEAVRLIEGTAVREQAIVWEQDGVKCKALIDMMSADGTITDLKTSADPSEKKFFWSMDDYGYHYSAAFYEMGRDAYWESDRVYPFYWIVVSNSGWIHCRVWQLQDELRDIAKYHIKAKLAHFKHCRESGVWEDHELNKSQVLHATNYYLEKNGINLIQGESNG